MKINYLILGLIVLIVTVFGCTQETINSNTGDKDAMMEKDTMQKDSMPVKEDAMMEKKEDSMMGYTGIMLNSNMNAKYLEFNKADYEKALKEKKKILLYFYASWCPICKTEQPNTISAFDDLKDSDLIGFRVNFNDGETDENEKALAKEFNVVYQHTKVILVDGKKYESNYPDSWNKEKYLEVLSKI